MNLVKRSRATFLLQRNVMTILLLLLSRFASSLEEKDYTENGLFKVSPAERNVLQQFRALIRPFLQNNYLLNDDIYLMRWLRSKDFNISEARKMLLDNLRWRRANNVDSILLEDFSDMHEDFPYLDGRDKQGRPTWNIRRAVRTGGIPRLIRYMTKLLEMGARDVTEFLEQGQNLPQFKIIANLDGFNAMRNACPLCLPVYTTFLRILQAYYPLYADQVIIVNTPPAFQTLLGRMRSFLAPRTRRSVKVFGRNRTVWMAYLEKDISREELTRVIISH